MSTATQILLIAAALAFAAIASCCASRGKAWRKVSPPLPKDPKTWTPADGSLANAPTIRGKIASAEGKADRHISCSFVEFDERGDYLDFDQHRLCRYEIGALREKADGSGKKLLLVVYCHGWKNNSQSGDVVEFNEFLAKLARNSYPEAEFLVHGIYLAWRGNVVRPYVEQTQIPAAYGEVDLVDSTLNRKRRWTAWLPENVSYWFRKGAAEEKVSGLPIARSVFTYAQEAKQYGLKPENRVVVMGHSFGALMLEQSLGQAMTGAIIMSWEPKPDAPRTSASESQAEAVDSVRPKEKAALPFDMVLLVNSAAPSIYAKQMRDLLAANSVAMGYVDSARRDVPVIISVTSKADRATRRAHAVANMFSRFYPSLQREYTSGIWAPEPGREPPPVHQSAFYGKTPGHQKLLVNHWIVPDGSTEFPADAFHDNLLVRPVPKADVFYTSEGKKGKAAAWRITTTPPIPYSKAGHKPAMADSNYWIVSCGGELISGHNDIWSTTAMEMYAGLFRAAESRRQNVADIREY